MITWLRLAWVFFIASWIALQPVVAASVRNAPPLTTGDAVQMSPYEVSANSVDFQGWIKVGSPHYLVYSDAKFAEVSDVLRELEALHLAAQSFFRRKALTGPPTILVLPTSRSDWRKIESKGHVEWKVAVSQPGEFVTNLILVQYDWQESGIWIVRSPQGRILLHAMNLEGPLWFERGVGKFFETAEFRPDSVTLGRQNPRTLRLSHDGWLAWPRFFKVTEKSPEVVRDGEIRRLDGQCAAFVQYMLSHPDAIRLDRLIHWVALMEAGREPEEAEFKEVFGQEFKAWQKTMETYLQNGRYQVSTFRLPPTHEGTAPPVKFDLPVREMRELFVVSQILNQNVPASEQALDALLAKGLKTESLRELLVEACFERKRREAGMDELRKLITAGSTNPAVYAMAAGMVFEQSAGKEPSIHARLGPTETEEIRGWCRKALEIEPLFKPANNLLAWTEAIGPSVDAGNAAAIEKIYHVLSGHVSTSDVLTALAVARWRAGNTDGAVAVSERLVRSPFADKEAKVMAEALLAEINRPTVPPAAATGRP